MDDRLLKYAKDQKAKGSHPGNLKYKLEQAGWKREDVDKVVHEVYGAKVTIKVLFIFILLIIVFITLLAILLLNKPAFVSTTNINNTEKITSCKNIIYKDLEKDACYKEEVAKGFECESLINPIEKSFCYRALDDWVLANN